MRFRQFYNNARCCPTRASLLTGLYSHQAGVGHMVHDGRSFQFGEAYRGYLNRNCVTIAEAMKEGGYQTAMSGKWHVGHNSSSYWPHSRGFQRSFSLVQGISNYFNTNGKTIALDGVPVVPENFPEYQGTFYITDAIGDYAVKYVDELTDETDPFFLYLTFTAPHWPIEAKQVDIDKYIGKYKAAGGWPGIRQQRYERMKKMGLVDPEWALTEPSYGVDDWETADQDARDLKMATYAAMIDCVDQNIGRVLSKLEEKGELNNTVIFFLSDNGACQESPGVSPSWANASNTPYRRYKHHNHEGGISTPLIVHWPDGIKRPGVMVNEVGHIIDIMATCVDVGHVSYPKEYNGYPITPLEGKSLLPIIKTGHRAGHDHICFEHEGNRACRKGKWKLVSPYYNGTWYPWELYDLEADRTEMHNLATVYPKKVNELTGLYEAWRERVGAVTPQQWQATAYQGVK